MSPRLGPPRRDLRLSALALAFAAGMAAFAAPAPAQEPNGRDWVRPPSDLPADLTPNKRDDPAYNLDTLFSALKVAPDETSAKAIENRIWSVWTASDSDTCALLMDRAKVATDAKDYDLALKLLTAITQIKPDYVEAWNRRATTYYMKDDYAHAIADIAEVLAREPRHFGALSGLGVILQELGDDKDALQAYRKALAIDPHLEHIPDVVKELSAKVEGRDI